MKSVTTFSRFTIWCNHDCSPIVNIYITGPKKHRLDSSLISRKSTDFLLLTCFSKYPPPLVRKSYRMEVNECNWRSVFRLRIVSIVMASTRGILQELAPYVNPAHITLWQDMCGSDVSTAPVETGGCSWSSLGRYSLSGGKHRKECPPGILSTHTGFQTTSHTAHKLRHGTHCFPTIWLSIGTELRERGVCYVRRRLFSVSFLFSPLFSLPFLSVLDMA